MDQLLMISMGFGVPKEGHNGGFGWALLITTSVLLEKKQSELTKTMCFDYQFFGVVGVAAS